MKIGLFDSGVGGVSILKELIKLIPNHSYYYLSDSKNNPYGDKTEEEIKKIIYKNVKHLIDKKCEIIVIACNTGTAVAIDELRSLFKDTIFVGTEPAIKKVFDEHTEESALLIATKLTLSTNRVKDLIKKYKLNNVNIHACVGLADIIENNKEEKIMPYFEEQLKSYKQVKRVILGCTHYSLIKEYFSKYFKDAILIDGSIGVAKEVKRKVTYEEKFKLTFYDTSNNKNKEKIFNYYLNKQ